MQFIDKAKIYIEAGKGGDGTVAFRREAHVPKGGPAGGDGGKGGSIIFEATTSLSTLLDFRYHREYKAKSGGQGMAKKMHGADGADMILKVPVGTVIYDEDSGRVLADLTHDKQRAVIAKGGRGGRGNARFATSRNPAPTICERGEPGEKYNLICELKLLADVGLVGFPSVGKSTLLSVVTRAKPEIADYHFTTIVPNLGVAQSKDGRSFVMADLPGLIEGASQGKGLGHQFLRHIERTKVMIHLVDAASVEGRDPIEDIKAINKELEAYNPELAKRPQVIAANKMDAMPEEDREVIIEMLEEAFADKDMKIFPISAVSGQGVKELLWYVNDLLKELPEEPIEFDQEYFFELQEDDDQESIVVKMEEPGVYSVEGPKVERMLGYTNLESEKGFEFFQKFMKENGILDRLEELGIEEGDTVQLYNLAFDYYK